MNEKPMTIWVISQDGRHNFRTYYIAEAIEYTLKLFDLPPICKYDNPLDDMDDDFNDYSVRIIVGQEDAGKAIYIYDQDWFNNKDIVEEVIKNTYDTAFKQKERNLFKEHR